MEKLQSSINPSLAEEDLDVGWLEEFVSNFGSNYKFEDPYIEESSSLEDKMPFLEMLQDETTAFPLMQEPNYFQLLLKLQHQKLLLMDNNQSYISNFANPSELDSSMTNTKGKGNPVDNGVPARRGSGEGSHHKGVTGAGVPLSCLTNNNITNDIPVKSETCNKLEEEPVLHEQNQGEKSSSKEPSFAKTCSVQEGNVAVPREKRKRKRPVKATKSKEDAESQRMTHIAVERNRRRQMNDHLNALRSLMPPSYAQRGDQASIIGGAIDYVKEMEQLLETLQAQKIIKQQYEENGNISAASTTTSSSSSKKYQFRHFEFNEEGNGNSIQVRRNNNNEEFIAENRSAMADIKVVVIQNHVNLKIKCHRRPCQLFRVLVAFEELRLTILHLNITSLHTLVHYSINMKIEEDCKLVTADEIVRAVHHVFNLINLS